MWNVRIKEVSIPTFYGEEISYLNTFKYGFRILKTTLISFLNKFNIFYERKFDVKDLDKSEIYREKIYFDSSHRYAIDEVKPKSKVLDIACDKGFIGIELIKKVVMLSALINLNLKM